MRFAARSCRASGRSVGPGLIVLCLVCALVAVWSSPLRGAEAPGIQSGPDLKGGAPSGRPGIFAAALESFNRVAESVGAQVLSLPSGDVVWEHRASEPMTPASTAKLFTSYAALKTLGPQYRFSTGLWAAAVPRGGKVQGDLWIRGQGDFRFSAEKAWSLAESLRFSGITEIRGGVIADSTFFEPSSERVCLDEKCGRSYNPAVSGTAIEYNTVTLKVSPGQAPGAPAVVRVFPGGDYVDFMNRAVTGPKSSRVHLKVQSLGMSGSGREKFQITGRVPFAGNRTYEYRFSVDDPVSFVSRTFRSILEQCGVRVRGSSGSGSVPGGAVLLAEIKSDPLSDLLTDLNRYSSNFAAEMLLRDVGALAGGPPGKATAGIGAILGSLRTLGVPASEVVLDNGSGLSRRSAVSPRALCAMLLYVRRDIANGPELIASLAVNARGGTLHHRMESAGTVVRGKTGTLADVVAFAGYVFSPGREPLIACVMLNGVKDVSAARASVDAFLLSLSTL